MVDRMNLAKVRDRPFEKPCIHRSEAYRQQIEGSSGIRGILGGIDPDMDQDGLPVSHVRKKDPNALSSGFAAAFYDSGPAPTSPAKKSYPSPLHTGGAAGPVHQQTSHVNGGAPAVEQHATYGGVAQHGTNNAVEEYVAFKPSIQDGFGADTVVRLPPSTRSPARTGAAAFPGQPDPVSESIYGAGAAMGPPEPSYPSDLGGGGETIYGAVHEGPGLGGATILPSAEGGFDSGGGACEIILGTVLGFLCDLLFLPIVKCLSIAVNRKIGEPVGAKPTTGASRLRQPGVARAKAGAKTSNMRQPGGLRAPKGAGARTRSNPRTTGKSVGKGRRMPGTRNAGGMMKGSEIGMAGNNFRNNFAGGAAQTAGPAYQDLPDRDDMAMEDAALAASMAQGAAPGGSNAPPHPGAATAPMLGSFEAHLGGVRREQPGFHPAMAVRHQQAHLHTPDESHVPVDIPVVHDLNALSPAHRQQHVDVAPEIHSPPMTHAAPPQHARTTAGGGRGSLQQRKRSLVRQKNLTTDITKQSRATVGSGDGTAGMRARKTGMYLLV